MVLVTGFSFLGYVANRIFGERHGTIATALIGGAYSSTAVTQSLAQRLGSEEQKRRRTSRDRARDRGHVPPHPDPHRRVRNARPARNLHPPCAGGGRRLGRGILALPEGAQTDPTTPPGNPIAFVPALGFLVFVAIAAVAATVGGKPFGESGIAVLLLIVGSMDVDVAILTLGGPRPRDFAVTRCDRNRGTVIVNMGVKIGITLVYASGKGVSAAVAWRPASPCSR